MLLAQNNEAKRLESIENSLLEGEEEQNKKKKKIIQTESSWGFERINGPFDNTILYWDGYWP